MLRLQSPQLEAKIKARWTNSKPRLSARATG